MKGILIENVGGVQRKSPIVDIILIKNNMEQKIEIRADATDIVEHLQTLADLAMKCNHITEMGVRNVVSTWPFVTGIQKGGKVISIDIVMPPEQELKRVSDFSLEKGIQFEFHLGDTTKIEIEETDLLFIDTLHEYAQLKKELELHADKAKKFIVIHDTESCKKELWPAIDEFLKEHKEWVIKAVYTNNNGLFVLRRC